MRKSICSVICFVMILLAGAPMGRAAELPDMAAAVEAYAASALSDEADAEPRDRITQAAVTTAEKNFILRMFGVGPAISELTDSALEITVRAFWAASMANGGQPTFYGTLKQVGSTSNFNYSPTPTDRMVVIFTNGKKFTIKKAGVFKGYVKEGWEEFLNSHQVEFTFFAKDLVNLHIVSKAYPDADYHIHWARNTKGTVVYKGKVHTVNQNDSGERVSSVEQYYVESEKAGKFTGTVTGLNESMKIAEAGHFHYLKSDDPNTQPMRATTNVIRSLSNSGKLGSSTFAFKGVYVKWATKYTKWTGSGAWYVGVIDPSYWVAQGSLMKNGTEYGKVQFSGPVVVGDMIGPKVIIKFKSGQTLELFKPITN